jgi:glycerophosphoryl diester phosphodiesterase
MADDIYIGGHRGMGCTDNEFCLKYRDITQYPVENTVESITAAFNAGADYVEIDAVMSKDGTLFTLHNVVPQDHFFGAKVPPDLLSKMDFSDILAFRSGRNENGTVSTLEDLLAAVASLDPHTADFCINIEMKGVQGSGIPPERILFSSFCLENILQMSQLLPDAQYGMLFTDKTVVTPNYTDHQDDMRYQSIPFDPQHIMDIVSVWDREAAPEARLKYLHPEIHSITPETVRVAKGLGLGINSWSIHECQSAEWDKMYQETAKMCDSQVPLTVITDYAPQVAKLLKAGKNTPKI